MSLDGELGRIYADRQKITVQGEVGDCMYVILKGKAEVLLERSGSEIRLAVLESGDPFGEMALFTKEPRSATVRAMGEVRVLKIDKRAFLKRVHQDPSLGFRILQRMSFRLATLSQRVAALQQELARAREAEVLQAI